MAFNKQGKLIMTNTMQDTQDDIIKQAQELLELDPETLVAKLEPNHQLCNGTANLTPFFKNMYHETMHGLIELSKFHHGPESIEFSVDYTQLYFRTLYAKLKQMDCVVIGTRLNNEKE